MVWIAGWLGLAGCQGIGGRSAEDAPDSSERVDEGESPPADDGPAEPAVPPPPAVVPQFQAHEVSLAVDDAGAIDIETTQWNWILADESGNELCATGLEIVQAEIVEPVVTDPPTFAAWLVLLQGGAEAPCIMPEPTEITVAVAAPDGRLAPILAENGDADLEVYSYTVQRGGTGPVTLHGIASTPDILDGDVSLVTEGPLPAGSYFLEPLLFLILE